MVIIHALVSNRLFTARLNYYICRLRAYVYDSGDERLDQTKLCLAPTSRLQLIVELRSIRLIKVNK